MELLTGRRPSLDTPCAELRAGDPRSDELERFLKTCLSSVGDALRVRGRRAPRAPADGHGESVLALHGEPRALSLQAAQSREPERRAAQSSDLESTNPVVVARGTAVCRRRRRGRSAAAARRRLAGRRGRRGRAIRKTSSRKTPAGRPPSRWRSRRSASEESTDAPGRRGRRPALGSPSPRPAAAAASHPAPGRGRRRLWPRPRPWPSERSSSRARSTRSAARPRPSSSPRRRDVSRSRPRRRPRALPIPCSPRGSFPRRRPRTAVGAAAPVAVAAANSTARASGDARPAANKTAPKVRKELRKPAEELRLRAALARIEADRLNARETAGAIFVQGRHERGRRRALSSRARLPGRAAGLQPRRAALPAGTGIELGRARAPGRHQSGQVASECDRRRAR